MTGRVAGAVVAGWVAEAAVGAVAGWLVAGL